MSRITEVNQKIRRRLNELDDDREDRARARRVVERTDARIDDLLDELRRARQRLQRRRLVIADLREDLDALEEETPDEDTEEEQELRIRLDRLSGEYDEAVTDRDRLLDRLDRLRDTRADARRALQRAIDESEEDWQALRRLRQRRQRIREARERRDQPSPHFDWAEFDCNDGTPIPENSKPSVRAWCQNIGEPLHNKYGPVHINSGHRHAAYNRRIGGESNSIHIYDYPGRNGRAVAADIVCSRGTSSEWYAFTAGKADGRGRYSSFHHADNRNRIGWSDATWTG